MLNDVKELNDQNLNENVNNELLNDIIISEYDPTKEVKMKILTM